MKVNRLHSLVHELKNEFEEKLLVSNVSQVVKRLELSMSQPNAQHEREFADSLDGLFSLFQSSRSNALTPSELRILEAIGGTRQVGDGLIVRIETTLEKRSIIPSAALDGLQEISRELSEFKNSLDALCEALDNFGLIPDSLSCDENEFGVHIPSSLTKEDLRSIEKEISVVRRTVELFGEVSGDDSVVPKVRSVCSTDLQVFVEVGPEAAAFIAVAIERIVALYKNIVEIKKIKKDLQVIEAPIKVQKPFDDYLSSYAEKEIKNLAKKLVHDYYKKRDAGRRNELVTAASDIIMKLVHRVDAGATLEVKLGIPVLKETQVELSEEELNARLEALSTRIAEIEDTNSKGRLMIDLFDDGIPRGLLAGPDEDTAVDPSTDTD